MTHDALAPLWAPAEAVQKLFFSAKPSAGGGAGLLGASSAGAAVSGPPCAWAVSLRAMPAAVGRPGGPPNIGRSSDKQHAGAVFSTMDQTYPKFEQASGGVGGSSAFPLQTDRWSGYEEIDVPEMERGWMPRQRTGFETQRRARQKKNQHDVVVGSKVAAECAARGFHEGGR